jgi:hypothetical protein
MINAVKNKPEAQNAMIDETVPMTVDYQMGYQKCH